MRLAFVGANNLGITQRAGGDIGAQYIAGLGLLGLLNRFVIRMDVSLDLPLDGLEWRARCGTPFTRVAFVFSQLLRLDTVILPALGQRCEGIVSSLRCAKALGLQVKELFCDSFVFALLGSGERGFGTFKSRL